MERPRALGRGAVGLQASYWPLSVKALQRVQGGRMGAEAGCECSVFNPTFRKHWPLRESENPRSSFKGLLSSLRVL